MALRLVFHRRTAPFRRQIDEKSRSLGGPGLRLIPGQRQRPARSRRAGCRNRHRASGRISTPGGNLAHDNGESRRINGRSWRPFGAMQLTEAKESFDNNHRQAFSGAAAIASCRQGQPAAVAIAPRWPQSCPASACRAPGRPREPRAGRLAYPWQAHRSGIRPAAGP